MWYRSPRHSFLLSFVLLLRLLLSSYAAADPPCVDHPRLLRWVGESTVLHGQVRRIVVRGPVAYVIEAAGSVNWPKGLQIVDVSDPLDPVPLGDLPTDGRATDLAVEDDLAFIADGIGGGLKIADVSDPRSPELLSVFPTPREANGVAARDGRVFVTDVDDLLLVLDASGPRTPVEIGRLVLPGFPRSVTLAGDLALIAGQDTYVVDVSDPTEPILVAAVDGSSQRIVTRGSHAFVAGSWALKILDLTSPASPVELGRFGSRDAHDLVIDGNYLFAAHRTYLAVYEVTDPAAAHLIGELSRPYLEILGVAVVGELLITAVGYKGLAVADIGNPCSAFPIGTVDTPGNAWRVAQSGDAFGSAFAFVADDWVGLQVLDLADPRAPVLIGGVETPGYSRGIALAGRHVLIADGPPGLQVVEVRDVRSPVIVGTADTPGWAYGVAVDGSVAYVADVESLQLVDVSEPRSPGLLGSAAVAGAVDVAVRPPYAFVAAGGGGLHVVDVFNPHQPFEVGQLPLPGWAHAVAVMARHVLVAAGQEGLHVVDVADPAAPFVAATLEIFDEARDVTAAGDVAYVAARSAGLQVVDLRDPTMPRRLGEIDTPARAIGVAIDSTYVLVADYEGGILVLPKQCALGPVPVLVSRFRASPVMEGLLLEWTASHTAGLIGFHVRRAESSWGPYRAVTRSLIEEPPYRYLDRTLQWGHTYYYQLESTDLTGRRELHGPWIARAPAASVRSALRVPGPVVAGEPIAIGVTLASPVPARLEVYDPAGRLVRTLLDEPIAAGSFVVDWDGRDARGQLVTAGVYLLRLEAGDYAQSGKLVLLR